MGQEPRPLESLALHGRRVRRWMAKNKVSMEELGQRMDPPRARQTVSQLLASRWPTRRTIEDLSKATGMPVEELTSRRHPKRPGGRPPERKYLRGRPWYMWNEEGEPEGPELNEPE